MSRYSSQKGFTLIELLVVISIISLLSSVVLAGLNSARAKARDAARKTEMKQLQSALELYFNDNGGYPVALGWRGAVGYGDWGTGATGYIPGLVPNYISILPLDPGGSGGGYYGTTVVAGTRSDGYLYTSDGKNYKLLSHYSPESYSTNSPFYDPNRPTWAWMVCSAEPACSTW